MAVGNAVMAPSGGELILNTTTEDRQDDFGLAAPGGGDIVAVYDSVHVDPAGIFLQRYTVDGARLGAEVRADPQNGLDHVDPVVAPLGGGGFLVAWTEIDDGLNADTSLWARRFDSDGAAPGGAFRVDEIAGSTKWRAEAAGLVDGAAVVVWETDDADGDSVAARIVEPDGSFRTPEVRVNATTAEDQDEQVVAPLADGGFVVAWTSADQDGDRTGVYFQRFAADGSRIGGERRANVSTFDDQQSPAVAGLAGGGFAVAWKSDHETDRPDPQVYYRMYRSDGAALTGERPATTIQNDSSSGPVVTALADGGAAIGFTARPSAVTSIDMFGQRVAADGMRIGEPFLVNTERDGTQWRGEGLRLDDDRVMMAWLDQSGDTDIAAQIFTPALGADGDFTDGADTVVLGDGGEAVAVLGGDDSVTGGAGDDTVRAGAGDDTVAGGAGADRIDGGPGSDTADYAASPGPVSVALGQPGQTGGDALGDVLVSIERLLGSARDDTLGAGAGDTTLSGGPGGDTLILGPGFDLVADALADLDGDRIEGARTGDAIRVAGTQAGDLDLSVATVGGAAELTLEDAGGESATVTVAGPPAAVRVEPDAAGEAVIHIEGRLAQAEGVLRGTERADVLPLAQNATYLGQGGIDTYLVSGAAQADGVALVEDAGANRVQLVPGLQIAGSVVTPEALQLTLANGAVLRFLQAEGVIFAPGGNATTGETGLAMDYATFAAEVLGVPVPDSGDDTGGPVTIEAGLPDGAGALEDPGDALF